MTLPDHLSRSVIVSVVNEWVVGQNAERDRAILIRRLADGITFDRLAEEFDLSVRHTKEIVYKRERKIFQHFPG